MAQTGVWGESRGESDTLVVVVAVVPNMYERALAHGVCVCVRVHIVEVHTHVCTYNRTAHAEHLMRNTCGRCGRRLY